MAISHYQPLLLLFVSLFFSLALCKTEIHECYHHADYYLPVSVEEVNFFPNPVQRSTNANITLDADTTDPLPTKGLTVKLELLGRDTYSAHTYSLCDVTTCPVASGPFRLFFTNIFNPEELKQVDPDYRVTIRIYETEPKDMIMCTILYCRLTGNRLLPYIKRITG